MMMLAVCLMVMVKMIYIGRAMWCCHGQNDDCDLVFYICIFHEKHRKTMKLAKMIIKIPSTISTRKAISLFC